MYSRLLEVTKSVRGKARFDLYSAQGAWLCSTRSVLRSEQLSPNWGLLPAAGRAGGLVFSAPEDPACSRGPSRFKPGKTDPLVTLWSACTSRT